MERLIIKYVCYIVFFRFLFRCFGEFFNVRLRDGVCI